MENIKLNIATADHIDYLFTIINDAYAIENGNSEISFKNDGKLRFNDKSALNELVENGDMTIAFDEVASEYVGCIYAPTFVDKDGIKRLYFGPLASKKRGIGKLLVSIAEQKAKDEGCSSIDIHVINIRSDILPWYQRNGYSIIGEEPYPHPANCSREVHFLVLRKII